MLARQIEHGAPFDLFFAANERFIEELKSKGKIVPETAVRYARGRITLAVLSSSNLKAAELKDLLRPEFRKVAIANPEHAPYGTAAMEALKKAGVWEAMREKLVYGENIRQALQFLQSGNAQAAVIALSIAGVEGVRHSLIDETLHNPIDQSAGVVSSSRRAEEAAAFLSHVRSPYGRGVLERYGFGMPE